MNYSNIYTKLINNGISRNFYSKKYRIGLVVSDLNLEAHHIIPKCLGGDNSKENLVVLTPREHFIAHLLLCKIYPDNLKVLNAFFIMMNRTPGKCSRNYEIYKNKFINKLKEQRRDPSFWTNEMILNSRNKMLENLKNPIYREKISKGITEYNNSVVGKQLKSKITKAKWLDSDYRNNQLLKMKNRWDNIDERNNVSKRVKLENTTNPELKKKRLDAIKKHMYNKSEEWIIKSSEIIKIRMNTPMEKSKSKLRYDNSKFDNRRKVINIETLVIYKSAMDAAKDKNLNYSTVKKWLNINNAKHNLKWLNLYNKELT